MIDKVLTQDGQRITADNAIQIREQARKQGKVAPIYMDPATGETVLRPRAGHKTKLSHAQSHFYNPSEVREAGLGTEKRQALASLEQKLAASREFVEFQTGLLSFYDVELAIKHDIYKPDFDYGFHVLWALKEDGKEYAVLVLNRVPNSEDYLNLLKSLGSRQKFDGDLKLRKEIITDDGHSRELGNNVYLATVQIKNEHMYRPNNEEPHPDNALLLGDWQAKHLSRISPEFTYIDIETGTVQVMDMEKFTHGCRHSDYRYGFKNKRTPEQPEFCQLAKVKYEIADAMTLEPHELAKDAIKGAIKSHPRLYLARASPTSQGRLF